MQEKIWQRQPQRQGANRRNLARVTAVEEARRDDATPKETGGHRFLRFVSGFLLIHVYNIEFT